MYRMYVYIHVIIESVIYIGNGVQLFRKSQRSAIEKKFGKHIFEWKLYFSDYDVFKQTKRNTI